MRRYPHFPSHFSFLFSADKLKKKLLELGFCKIITKKTAMILLDTKENYLIKWLVSHWQIKISRVWQIEKKNFQFKIKSQFWRFLGSLSWRSALMWISLAKTKKKLGIYILYWRIRRLIILKIKAFKEKPKSTINSIEPEFILQIILACYRKLFSGQEIFSG